MSVFQKIICLICSIFIVVGLQGCGTSDESQDSNVSQAIINKIKTETQIPEEMITVETNDGSVMLTGTVETSNEEKQLIDLAKSVQGVKNVESRLLVKETAKIKEEIPVPAPQPIGQTPSVQHGQRTEANQNPQAKQQEATSATP